MVKRYTQWTFEIVVEHGSVSEAALRVVPRVIRTFAAMLKTKLAVLGGDGSWMMECTGREQGGVSKDFPLTVDEADLDADDNPER